MPPPKPIQASPKTLSLLNDLHSKSQSQEHTISMYTFWAIKLLTSLFSSASWSQSDDDYMRDKFIALEPAKCEFIYLIARSSGARNIVEAGTSFGVSTIYLALAAGQNAASRLHSESGAGKYQAKVIATEKEASKAKQARQHWRLVGDEVEPWITLLEGDLLETLPAELERTGDIDLLLLDIWIPLALPTLQLVKPRLRRGALIITDMTGIAKKAYSDLLGYLHDPANGFKTMTTPFSGGLEVTVYLPDLE
ncbi:S-adenosyl-L-methionine-dependent methyltransferase [Aspergillus granulosus]|uniref:S-adenosyl-L-methionine-dependent methyltransferase n=1 Tax=Aspergillus granulosus TaxID=176169 RepID=A0ABR4HXU8_9EURO